MAVWLTSGFILNSQNVANNTSNVTAWIDANSNYGSWNNNDPAPYGEVTFWGNGATGAIGFRHIFNANTTTRIYTRTYDVAHNADGTARISLSAWFDTEVSSGRIYTEASMTLPTIPRASTPTVSGTKSLGSTMTITTNRASSSFTHTLKWTWAGKSGTIATGVGASTTWTPSIATFAPYLTNATSAQCTITCDTYNGSSLIGTKTVSFTLSIPSSVVPSISSVTASDANNYYSTYGSYVQTKSSIKAAVSASGVNGSTIKTYKVEMDGKSTSGSGSTLTIGTPSNSGSRTIKATVTDSRGRTATKSVTITVAAYSAPSLSGSRAYRYNSSTGAEDDEATTIRVLSKGTVSNVNNKGANKGTVVVSWKLSSSSSFTTASTHSSAPNSFSYTDDLTGKSTESSFIVQIKVTDSFGTVTTTTIDVGTAAPVLDFKSNGKGLGIGTVATNDGLTVGMSSVFNAYSNFKGNSDHQGVESFNGATYFNDAIRMNKGYWGARIPANSDLNNYTTPGFYYTPSTADAKTIAHSPTQIAYCLEVFQHAGTMQRVTEYTADYMPRVYFRNFYNGTWGGWCALMTQDVKNNITLWSGYSLNLKLKGDASSTPFVKVNTSTGGTELNWTSGGLQGRIRKIIWSGSWSGGSLTISDLPYYNIFLVTLADVSSRAICVKETHGASTSNIFGGAVSPYYANGVPYASAVMLTVSNNTTLTYQHAMVIGLTDLWNQTRAITAIEGVI